MLLFCKFFLLKARSKNKGRFLLFKRNLFWFNCLFYYYYSTVSLGVNKILPRRIGTQAQGVTRCLDPYTTSFWHSKFSPTLKKAGKSPRFLTIEPGKYTSKYTQNITKIFPLRSILYIFKS